MKILLAILLAILLVPATVSADDSGYTGEWWLTPPPPPNAGNAEDWPFDTYYFEPTYKNVDSGPSWQEVQIQQLQIEPEPYWMWT